ncbi:MAG: hypothetical protein QM755_23695 [Luteolibacter sp.]
MSVASPVQTVYPSAAASAVSAYVETAMSGNNNDLRFTWNMPGTVGNGKTVAGTFSGSYSSVAVATTGNPVTGIVITGPASATAAQVMAAVKNTPAVSALVSVQTKLGNDGSGTMATFSAITMANGSGTAPDAPITTL